MLRGGCNNYKVRCSREVGEVLVGGGAQRRRTRRRLGRRGVRTGRRTRAEKVKRKVECLRVFSVMGFDSIEQREVIFIAMAHDLYASSTYIEILDTGSFFSFHVCC